MSFPEYRGYSACEIPGVAKLPKQWKALKLKHLASIKFSNVDKNKEEGEQPVSLCNYVDVYHNEWITPELDFMEATASQREIDKFSLKVGDVLVTKDSESWDDIAVPAYVASETESTLCGYHLAQIRPKPEAIDGRYLFRAFDAQAINDQFKVAANGITRFGLGKYWLDNALFPVPPLQDQRAIADFLDRETARIDELIAKKQRQIELLQEKRAAVISHAVTKGLNPDAKMKDSGIEWLGEIPEHWSIGAIAWIGRVMNGSTPSNSKPDYWEDGSVPWVSSAEVNQGLIVNPTAYITEQALRECCIRLIPRGSVLIGMVGQGRTRGMCAILGIEACINQNVAAIIPGPKAESSFLQHALTHLYEPIRQYGRGGQQDALNCELVGNIRVPIPPIEEQKAIADFLNREHERIKALSAMITNSMRALAEYRSALISAAVTGKIDVRGKEAA